MRVLIVYGTTEGHTRQLCEFVAGRLREHDHEPILADATKGPPDPAGFDAALLAASLHIGRYQAALVHFARRRHEALNAMPSGFISVSLSAAGENPDDWAGLGECLDRFRQETLWAPRAVHQAAGAIRYSQYDFFKRLALKHIASRRGRTTTTAHDYDLTDYGALERFALEFLAANQSA